MRHSLKIKIIIFFIASILLCNSVLATSSISKDLEYQVCFTPGQPCTALITNTISRAKDSIYLQAYSFTSADIANALLEAKKRGIKLFVILDKSQLKQHGSQLEKLLQANTPVWIDNKVAIAHNKVMIIDKTIVITGSFNFTSSAQRRNAENLLIINNSELAMKYLNNWESREKNSFYIKN